MANDALETYRRKRNFRKTPEPRGKKERKSRGSLRFVVQEHHARRLHYDFRLEIDGVLKSWAVPKGPSMDPAEKRLAVATEDHPLAYGDFQGVIPEREYGGGTVAIWDRGTYAADPALGRRENEKYLRAGLERGRLSFVLSGERLRGRFALARLSDGKSWLLMKSRDEEALAISSETRGRGRTRPSKTKQRAAKPAARTGTLARAPRVPRPMLATLADAPFDHPDWLFEIKWDGYRAIADLRGDRPRLCSRNAKSFFPRYRELEPALERIGRDAVLDGEVVVLDEAGHSSFQRLQYFETDREGALVYYAFDLLAVDGRDLTDEPLLARKRRLKALLKKSSGAVRFSDHVLGRGKAFFREAVRQGLEGIVAKDARSTYEPGKRSRAWLKIKGERRQEAVIVGYTAPRGRRKHLGALVVALQESGGLRYAGHVGTGFSGATLARLRERLDPLVREEPPLEAVPATNAPVRWVEPVLVAEITFREWTDDGVLRQPVYVGLRDDKSASEARRERPVATREARSGRKRPATSWRRPKIQPAKPGDDFTVVKAAGHDVKLTHLKKIYFPEDRITKGDVLAYYRAVAGAMLPYLRGRPQSLHRHPDGIDAPGFYHKDYGAPVPPWLRTHCVPSESTGSTIRYLVVDDVAGLLFVANLGCIEINPWFSRVESLERPDYLVLDLDPEDIAFEEVVRTARTIHRLLERIDVPSYCKTSGATGLHVYVPLGARYDFEQAKTFAEIIARIVERQLPATTSTARSPAKRQKRVYLDYLQNRRGQTLAAPYSLRPRPGAPVATPLRWSEVTVRLDPRRFTGKVVLERLEKRGDLFEPVLGKGIDLPGALRKLEAFS
jgi:bifunctional non-homologous end joining protein LigD